MARTTKIRGLRDVCGRSAGQACVGQHAPSHRVWHCLRRRLREQVKEGVDQLSALLESVMLLGQLAQDIAVVKADIKQVLHTELHCLPRQ